MLGRNKSETVYESLLREYLQARQADLEKTATARAKVDEADKTIEANKSLMEEATAAGDMPTYTALKIETTKAEECKKFYKGVLAKAEQNPCISPEAALAMYRKANAEIEKIKQEYNRAMVEAVKPIIELSNDTWLKIYLLQYAMNRIESNLEHKPRGFYPNLLAGLHVMGSFDKLLQTDEYKQNNPDVPGDVKLEPGKRYEWQDPAKAAFKEEAAKWI